MKYLKQTDFPEIKDLYHAGCWMMTLLTIAQKTVEKLLDKEQVRFIYGHLITRGYMKPSCWVLDPAAVINEGLSILIEPNVRAKYVGAFYVDESLGTSWGERKGDFIAVHVRTKRGNGHFRLFDYDPYFPSPEYDTILSIRYFRIERS